MRRVLHDFMDCWPTLRGEERGYTFDSDADDNNGKHEQMPYDCVMFRGPPLQPVRIELLGTEPVGAYLGEAEAGGAGQPDRWRARTLQQPLEVGGVSLGALASPPRHGQHGESAGEAEAATPPPRARRVYPSDHFGLVCDLELKGGGAVEEMATPARRGCST